MDIVWTLTQAQAHLTPLESWLARFVLDHLDFSARATVAQLAEKSGVSQSTLDQFARSVGCLDSNDFMAQLYALRSNAPLAGQSPALRADMDYSTSTQLEKLAQQSGVTPDILQRFARSIGREHFGDIVFQIRSRLNELSQQEGRVAQMVLNDVSFASSATIEQLATRAGVSAATITRFAKSVGCDDIRELRMKLAQAATSQSPDASLPALWQQQLSEVENALHQQLQHTPQDDYLTAAQHIRKARSVTLFAREGSDALFAAELQQRLLAAGIMASLCQQPSLMKMTAASLSDEHVLLVIASDKPDSQLHAAVLMAHEHRLPIIALAANSSPLTDLCSLVLPLPDTARHARYGILLATDLLLNAISPD